MAKTGTDKEIILFCYDISVFARRLERYLDLRGIKYHRCIQPPNMPRPDLAALGINYRRIPILAIGRDIYIDTRIMIDKLEELFPHGRLGSGKPFDQGIAKVLEGWVIDAGPFWRTSGCIPVSSPVVNDPVWMQDRSDGSGGKFTRETLVAGRAECLAHLSFYFSVAERLLADGRKYFLDTPEPGVADIHAWSFDWGINMSMQAEHENAGEDTLNATRFPHVFAWDERFRKACDEAREKHGEPPVISSQDAIKRIVAADFTEREGQVDASDPLQLKKGQRVKVTPTDFGFTHSDEGELVALSTNEVVIASRVRDGEGVLRLHYPRTNFSIVRI